MDAAATSKCGSGGYGLVMSDELAAFLLDRIRGDQFRAENLHTVADLLRTDNPDFADLIEDTARQILAVCETKRLVAERIRDSPATGKDPSQHDINVAQAFAAAYRDDPDYQADWTPSL